MNITLHRPRFAQDAYLPSSKSEAHRMLIAAAFASSKSDVVIHDAGEDIEATTRCLQALGARIRPFSPPIGGGMDYFVSPMDAPVSGATLDCGESGSTLRFLVPIVAALGVDATFLRRGRLAQRPMDPLTAELARHGVTVTENADGSLCVSGQLTAGDYEIAANSKTQLGTVPFSGQGLIEIEYQVEGKSYRNHFLYGEPPFKWADVKEWMKDTALWRH